MQDLDMALSRYDVDAARIAISGAVRSTPVWPSSFLSEICGVPVLLKCEQMQRTGSFKIRGATNFLAGLPDEARGRGVTAASAGNHAQGVALAAQTFGVDATVVVPANAPLAKVAATRGYGARVIVRGEGLDDARQLATEIAEREGRVYIPPFDHDLVIAGQGTVGLEVLEQTPDVAEVLVPAGGGGLLAGIAVAVKATHPHVRVVGVQPAVSNGIVRSLGEGRVTAAAQVRSLADGAAVPAPSERTFDLITRFVDEVVQVNEAAIASAVVNLLERAKMVVEGAGALGVAALLSGDYQPRGKAVVVLSGGNIDINLLGTIVRHGLVEHGRYQHLAVEVTDTPGQLALVSAAIAEAGGNVIEVEHNREAPGMPVGIAVLDLLLEVNGADHFAAILEELVRRGLHRSPGRGTRLQTEGARRLHAVD